MAVTVTSSTPTTGTLSAAGVGSGLDVSGLVSKLMDVENRKLTAIDTQKSSYQSKLSAYGQVKSALATFQSALASLKNPAALSAVSAKSSDATYVGASVNGKAVGGAYAVQVTQLAKAAKLASDGFVSTGTTVGTGTLTFDFGTFAGGIFASNGNGAKTVTIGTGEQTLSGIRDAVNAAGIGVTATIVNDGSASGNRIVFTSTATGAANSLKVTTADSDGNNVDAAGLSQLAFDPAATAGTGRNMTQKVAAQDAKLTIDGIDVVKPSNSITDAIDGLTLTLVKETTGTGVSLTVASDTSAPTKAVNDMVTAYNTLIGTLRGLTKYDTSTQKGSVLTGDSLVRSVQSRINGLLGNAVDGLPTDGSVSNSLWQAGVSFKADGTLSVDATKLASLAARPDGIARLFASIGKATDGSVSVAATGTATKAGTYSLAITQLATQGNLAGSDVANLSIAAGVNDQLDITIDGVAATVKLTPGTYASADALAAEVQSKINGATAIANTAGRVTVTNSGGVLTLTSARYGSASKVALQGNAASSVIGSAAVATTGLDVAGTIDGMAGMGSGQTLKAAIGSAAEGLQLAVAGGALGNRGTVTFSRGYATAIDATIADMLDADGAVTNRTVGINKSIADLDKQRTAMAARLAVVQAHYQKQFSALDTMLGTMQTTSSFLTQQLAALPKINTSG